jgi:nicotinate-nucleotide pyrophosphorylase (carboxylating)
METARIASAKNLISLAFKEDLGDNGDITSLALGEQDAPAHAKIIAKQDGVISGLDIVPLVFQQLDARVSIYFQLDDGARISNGECILELDGPATQILLAERTILNFIGRLSGIATLTRQFVDAVSGTEAKILDTRKTTPGWRLLEKYAVICGGGKNHRIGLYDMFLIKENHIERAGGISEAVRGCRQYMERNNFKSKIEVEAQTLVDVQEAMELGVDQIMLDNMSLDQMRECVALAHGIIPLEASGNVNLTRVEQIAETGVDYISIGALTHSPPVLDTSLLLNR